MPKESDELELSPEFLDLLDLICAKWTLVILMTLKKKGHRFGELKRAIPGISTKVLTQFLRALERNGIVSRSVAASVPPRTDYALTKTGRELVKHHAPVGKWAMSKKDQFRKAREAYDAANK